VNRVATARACFERLHAQGLQAVLLTGRVRAADRDRELTGLLPRIAAGRVRNAADTPLFVVATQTVEVGADLDFDALVTECASLSALRQRFGRLDRLGLRQASHATIVRRLSRERADPVYGDALAAAWDWLQTTAARHRPRPCPAPPPCCQPTWGCWPRPGRLRPRWTWRLGCTGLATAHPM
jgi:CRISPR-associated endonuclease/helicase Cas3